MIIRHKSPRAFLAATVHGMKVRTVRPLRLMRFLEDLRKRTVTTI